jgi:hypothetical protein
VVPFQFIGFGNPDIQGALVDITYDGSGVPALSAGRALTLVDDGTGLFSVVTDFPWKHAWPAIIRKCVLAVGGTVELVSQDPATRKVSFRIVNDADAAEDPADGDGVIGAIFFQKSGLPV